ncbi:MAG: hypothetical protein A2758_02075 [Candidatus Zambryskibacteria bacterium RIFCSPHIGHO2_01_FULL_49_18]|uniref:Uncharacterized protein n=2 Tax=Candidatus Zambryskiibacteriota TaxID=1817925 RepID=A0A1G2T1T6_9BACT|nr:MAG: hypothetical protein A2758_02075 [Candidatus Zambryskibacteria bacterium RIFCSPHIGHO2_01_FULL_49_18]OHB06117.1 MAG: hypothetical protein A3A26_01030 [Candidatus Zambryskibacteria bacterium RIFCSPLOWO2_01_FULL_47_14]
MLSTILNDSGISHRMISKREKIFLISFGVLILIIYGQSLWGGFVFDDRGIKEHQALLSSIDNIIQVGLFPYWTVDAGLYRPITLLSYLFNNILLDGSAFSFHLVNLVLYFGICAAIYFLIKRLFSNKWFAYLSAMIFLVLPIHSEVVANITGRSELLSLLFALLVMFEFTKEKINPWLAGLWMFLAIGSKETAVAVVPLVALMMVIQKRKVISPATLGVAVGAAVYFLLRLIVLGPGHFLGVETSIIENPLLFVAPLERITTALAILWMYVSKTLWPVNLCSDYSYNQIPVSSFSSFAPWLGLIILLGSVISVFWFLRYRPVISFASAIFLASFIPVSSLLFPMGTIAGERLFFFPSLGFAIIVALLLSRLRWKWLSLLLLIPYVIISLQRQSVWMSEEKLFLNAVECSPNSVLSLSNVGTVYYFRGDYEMAAKYLEKSKAIKPVYSKGLNNLGLVYWKEGRFREAEDLFHQSLKQKYPYWGAVENLVLLKLSEGDREGALRWLKIIYPNVDDSVLRSQFSNQRGG